MLIEELRLLKYYLMRECLTILKRDNNCIDHLPLDKDILDKLSNTKYLKYIGDEIQDERFKLDHIEEPGIISSKETRHLYGYKLAAKGKLPFFILLCIESAVNLQILKHFESCEYNKNEDLDQERIKLLDEIDLLDYKIIKLYEKLGEVYKFNYEDFIGTIKNTRLLKTGAMSQIKTDSTLRTIPVGVLGATGLGKDAAEKLGIGFDDNNDEDPVIKFIGDAYAAMYRINLSLFSFIGGITSLIKERQKKDVINGYCEAEQYFSDALSKLHDSFKEPTIQALKAVNMLDNDIVAILADINEGQYIISQKKLLISYLEEVIGLKESQIK